MFKQNQYSNCVIIISVSGTKYEHEKLHPLFKHVSSLSLCFFLSLIWEGVSYPFELRLPAPSPTPNTVLAKQRNRKGRGLRKQPPPYPHYHHHHHHLSLNHEGRWGTTDDFAASFLHFFHAHSITRTLGQSGETKVCKLCGIVRHKLHSLATIRPPTNNKNRTWWSGLLLVESADTRRILLVQNSH